MKQQQTIPSLREFLTLKDIAQRLGASYYAAYALAASGLLGDPLVIGGKHFYPRVAALEAIRRRRAQRLRFGRTASFTEDA